MPTAERIAEYAAAFGWGYDYDQDGSYFVYDKDGEQHIMVEYDGTITAEAMLDALRVLTEMVPRDIKDINTVSDVVYRYIVNKNIDNLPAAVVEAVYQAGKERG